MSTGVCVCQGGQVAVTVPRQVVELPVTHPHRGWKSPGNVAQVLRLVSPLFDCVCWAEVPFI